MKYLYKLLDNYTFILHTDILTSPYNNNITKIMNILINRNTLRNALHDIIGVVSKDLSMPILSHVLIEKNGKKQINITGTNLEMQITVKADFLESDEFDPITVPGRKLYEIVRSLDRSKPSNKYS